MLAVILSSCSSVTPNGDIEGEILAPEISYKSANYTTDTISGNDYSEEWRANLPAVTDLTENSFVLLYVAFKKCPNVIEGVDFSPNQTSETPYRLKITYEDHAGENSCDISDNDEPQFTATKIILDGVKIPLTGNLAVEAHLPDAPILSPVPYFPDEESIKFFEESQQSITSNPATPSPSDLSDVDDSGTEN